MLRDAAVIASKDLRIETRSRVITNQTAPFAVLVLVLFAVALDPDRGVLTRAAPGLFWVAVLFSALLAVQRSTSVELSDGALDGLRLSGLDPAGVFLGKAGAVALQLLALELVLGLGIAVLYDAELSGPVMMVLTALTATAGLAAAGTVYGAVATGLSVRETLLPLLLLPVVAPVLLAATRAWEASFAGVPAEAWPWVQVLAVFAAVYVALGIAVYGALLEEAGR